MSFTIDDLHDLYALLERHPEWRQELRRMVLTEELLALPAQIMLLQKQSETQFQALTTAQQRTDAQLTALTEQVAALTTAQQRTDAQLTALTEQVAALTTAQQRTDAQLSSLLEQSATLTDHVGELRGFALEDRYRTRGAGSFSQIVRRPYILDANELTTLIEDARDNGVLSEAEANDLFDVDIVVRGRQRGAAAATYLAVEVSWGVGLSDVERAARRAALLARMHGSAIPVVAGKWINHDAVLMAQDARAWQLIEGRVIPPTAETTSG